MSLVRKRDRGVQNLGERTTFPASKQRTWSKSAIVRKR
jgi:hypothetical protein